MKYLKKTRTQKMPRQLLKRNLYKKKRTKRKTSKRKKEKKVGWGRQKNISGLIGGWGGEKLN